MYRNSYVSVDLDRIRFNAEYFAEKTGKKVIGVVKANGYGTIDHMEVSALKEAGVSFFAVSSLDEALNLRKYIADEILILGYVPSATMEIVRDHNLSIVTVSREYVENTDLKDVKVHLKLNTGMNRIGVRTDEAKEILEILKKKGARIEGVMSHFSSADDDIEYSKKQYQHFKDCVMSLNYDFPAVHMSATDASIAVDDDICTHCRIGLGLLGYSAYETKLLPSVGLYSEVVMCKHLEAGEPVSYGRHYTSDGNGFILTIPLGYADGFYRKNTGKQVYVENEYGTIVGSICMDQLMILTEHPHAVGTSVELFGPHVDIVSRAAELSTITYELLTSLSERLTRVYYKDGKEVCRIDPHFRP